MAFEVKKAKRSRRPLKISLEGLSGSGKTYSALRLAFAMRRAGIGRRVVVADSENESAGLYEGVTSDGERWEYETCAIPADKQNPAGYAECYEYLVRQGFDLIIMDSLSHAWHGAMEQVDAYAKRNKGDKFGGWAQVTPDQRRMLSTLTDGRAHLIATMRVKSEYERVQQANGRDKIQKVGMKTDQRDGAEYEFDCVVRLDAVHEAAVEKVRGCTAMDGKVGRCPGPEFWKPLFDWWLSAEPVAPVPPAPAPQPAPAKGSNLPATGAELHARLKAYDARLAKEGICGVGILLDCVVAAGKKAGYPADLTQWSGAAIPFAVEVVKEIEKDMRYQAGPAKPADQPTKFHPTPEAVFALCEQIAPLISSRPEILVAELCARCEVGSLDDMTPDQLADAVAHTNTLLPAGAIFDAGAPLAAGK